MRTTKVVAICDNGNFFVSWIEDNEIKILEVFPDDTFELIVPYHARLFPFCRFIGGNTFEIIKFIGNNYLQFIWLLIIMSFLMSVSANQRRGFFFKQKLLI